MAERVVVALRSEDPSAGWELLAPDAQRAQRWDDFVVKWRTSKKEREQRAAALERTLREGEQVGERAQMTLADGPEAQLVRERDGWRLEAPLYAKPGAASPADALRLFARALDERSVTGVLRLLTSARREDVRRALDRFAGGLRDHVADGLDVTGDHATVVWHDGEHRFRVTLKRENGEWRIDDFSEH